MAPFKPIPVLKITQYNDPDNMAAIKACAEFDVQTSADAEKLKSAKELVYKIGFYDGILLVGKYAGMKIADAKVKVRDDLIKEDLAAIYYEPEGKIISRSGGKFFF